MKYNLPDVRDAEVKGKRVLVRVDLDVPIAEVRGQGLEVRIEDDTRLKACLPTIELLIRSGASIVLAGHLGRPEKVEKRFSLEPIARWFSKKFTVHSSQFTEQQIVAQDFLGWKIGENVFLLENLRFYKEEQENDSEFSKKLSLLCEVFVNEAFAASHRIHASIVGVPKYVVHFAGIRFQKEAEVLSSILNNPKRPLVVIVAGAKIETKLPLIEKMHEFADYVLVGGKIASEIKELIRVAHAKISHKKSVLLIAELNSDETDMTQMSLENFLQIIQLGKTIVWNGPVGKIEEESHQSITKALAESMLESRAYTVVGGGDTVSFLQKEGLLQSFSFVSTGGGAMLSFLSGEELPGIKALLG